MAIDFTLPPETEDTRRRVPAFLADLPADGFEIVRDIHTITGRGNHCEVYLRDVRVPQENLLGERGGGHRLGQARLGPARLAHCMR